MAVHSLAWNLGTGALIVIGVLTILVGVFWSLLIELMEKGDKQSLEIYRFVVRLAVGAALIWFGLKLRSGG